MYLGAAGRRRAERAWREPWGRKFGGVLVACWCISTQPKQQHEKTTTTLFGFVTWQWSSWSQFPWHPLGHVKGRRRLDSRSSSGPSLFPWAHSTVYLQGVVAAGQPASQTAVSKTHDNKRVRGSHPTL